MRWRVAILIMLFAAMPASAQQQDTLRQLGDARGKLIGTAVDMTVLATDERYRDVIATHFSSVTPENVMKWGPVERDQGQPDYSAGDRLVQFAHANGQQVRGHTLVWHNQLPAWLTGGTFSDAELAQILNAHVTDEASHFAGQLYAWDVVNEPFNDDGTWRNSIWYRAMGTDYVGQALLAARAADPTAKLYVNDYNVEGSNPKSDALYALAQDLLARGVPLDGVGIQAHLGIQYGFPSSLQANLQRFADLGLDVAITEADVRVGLPVDDSQLTRQADYFRQLMAACLAVQRCVSYTVWGFTDAHSWVPTTFQGQGAATLFDESLAPKPAFFAIRDALAAP